MSAQNDNSNVEHHKEDSERGSRNDDEKKRLISKQSAEDITYNKEVPIESNSEEKEVEKFKYNGPTKNVPIENDDAKIGFGCFERFKYNLFSSVGCKCANFKKSFAQRFVPSNFVLDKEESERMLEIKVLGTGALIPKSDLIHPFIKIHFVDVNTSQYIQKSKPEQNIMPFNENLCLINNTNSQGNSQKLEYKDTEVSFMLPLSTRPCDLRITGETKAEYNEAFIIKELVSDVFKTNTVMIFEVLDYGHKLILEGKEKLNREKLLPIAWGYLRVIGESSKHFGKHRVQLYQYKYQTNQAIVSKGIDLRTPEVFFDFNWPFHVF